MDDLMATVRPIRWKNDTAGPTHHYDVEALGSITGTVRYTELEDLGVVEILDEARLPYVEGAEGFGLWGEDGALLTTVQIFSARRGEDLTLPPGWGFKASRANVGTGTRADSEVGAATGG
jgi:hypothetical protein